MMCEEAIVFDDEFDDSLAQWVIEFGNWEVVEVECP